MKRIPRTSVPALRRLLLVALCALGTAPAALAQMNASLNVTSTYDDNSFSFYERRADAYHQAFLGLSKDFSTDYSFTQAFYYGAGVLFRTYNERNYHQHLLGTVVSIQLDHRDDGEEDDDSIDSTLAPDDSSSGDDSTEVDGADSDSTDTEEADSTETSSLRPSPRAYAVARRIRIVRQSAVRGPAPRLVEKPAQSDSVVTYLQLKPSIGGRFDRKEYKLYDYQAATMLASFRLRIGGPFIARLQYEGEYKRYPSFRQFTHFEHNATITGSARLGAGPELFASANYGVKQYTETVSDTVFLTTGGGGKGKGGVKPTKKKVSQYSTPSTSQIVLGGGLVQPIGLATLSLSVLRRLNPENTARYVDRRGIADATEDTFFDDRYGYQGTEVLLGATLPLFRVLQTTVEVGAVRKAYPTSATDLSGENLAGDPQRVDARYTLSLHVGLPLLRKGDGAALLTIGAGYQFVRNRSNDAYHRYDINQGMVTIEAGL